MWKINKKKKGGGKEKNMKVAVTYENEEVFQHFGHTKYFKIYSIEENKIIKDKIIDVKEKEGHGALAGLLSLEKVDILICGGIGNGAKEALKLSNIKLYSGITGKCDDVITKFIDGKLEQNENANCNHHHNEEHNCKHNCDKNGCK